MFTVDSQGFLLIAQTGGFVILDDSTATTATHLLFTSTNTFPPNAVAVGNCYIASDGTIQCQAVESGGTTLNEFARLYTENDVSFGQNIQASSSYYVDGLTVYDINDANCS